MRQQQVPFSRFVGLIALVIAQITVLIPEVGLAHAVVTATSLQTEAIRPDVSTRVLLFFNSNVELRLSRVYLVRKGDTKESLTIKPGKKPGEVVVLLPALPIGEYALSYKIFAADSHITEDILRFRVDQPH